MRAVSVKAPGKLNLTLDVLGKRDDGYHDMKMIMQSVDLLDTVTVTLTENKTWECVCDIPGIPSGMDNLALKAANTFFEALGTRPDGLHISIAKTIPMQGGMAGGSTDAAAVLRGLNQLHGSVFSADELAAMGAKVGSDVPYCVMGGTALAEGRGEILTPLPSMPECFYVLVKPEFSVSTPALFRELDANPIKRRPDTDLAVEYLKQQDLFGFCSCIQNVFQPILEKSYPVISGICTMLKENGALASSLTGTGSVVFGIFSDLHLAQLAEAKLSGKYRTYLVRNA